MAATTRRRVGRPKLPGSLKLIRLRESVFDLWRTRKQALGFEKATDSEFAEFLLHGRRTDTNRGYADVNLPLSFEDNGAGALPLFSTPVRTHRAPRSHSTPLQSSIVDITSNSTTLQSSIVDVTSNSTTLQSSAVVDITSNSTTLQSSIADITGESRRSQLFDSNNDSLPGNPFSVLESGSDNACDDSECESLSGENTAVEPNYMYDYHHFADLEQSVSVILEELNKSDTCTSSDEDSDDSEWSAGNAEDDEYASGENDECGTAENFDGNMQQFLDERHTSVLESYNSMLTKYAPKRMAFEYPFFIMRIMLAAIDHNMHLSRGKQLNAAGDERGHRKYSKRMQKFHAEIVKEEKAYKYFPYLMAKMLKERCLLQGRFSQPTDDNLFNPKQIAPTIGMKVAPSTEELLKGPSRLAKPPPQPEELK